MKKVILDEFCKVCKYHRKHAIRLLNGVPPEDRKDSERTKENTYLNQTITILQAIWEAAGFPWSTRLKAIIPLWLPWIRKHYPVTPEIKQQLLAISSATIDRRLKDIKERAKKRIYTTTKPGYLLKSKIPVKTDSWDVHKPGFTEIDLVAHCGSSLEGTFINSLNCVDIHTTWTETRALLGKGQMATFKALQEIKDSLPFELKGIDPDNDGCFINYHLWDFCKEQKIQFTRSRPYKKDDNAHIEQKNWTHVRKIFGYMRYESETALSSMNDLYCNELRWFQNFFQPSVKLIKKTRVGSRLIRIYDKPKTPFQRLCACKSVKKENILELKKLYSTLDPFQLSKTIDKKLNAIYHMSTKRPNIQKTFEERLYADIKKNINAYDFSNVA